MRRRSLLLLVCVALAACGGGSSDDNREAQPSGGLSDLTSVDQLATRFGEDRGEPRLLLLLSPT